MPTAASGSERSRSCLRAEEAAHDRRPLHERRAGVRGAREACEGARKALEQPVDARGRVRARERASGRMKRKKRLLIPSCRETRSCVEAVRKHREVDEAVVASRRCLGARDGEHEERGGARRRGRSDGGGRTDRPRATTKSFAESGGDAIAAKLILHAQGSTAVGLKY